MNLHGIKIAFLGDSITEGVGVQDMANRFDNRIAAKYGAQAVNFGIGGTRLAHQRFPSEKPRHDLCFCGRVYDLPKDADLIVVYGGTNDYGHGDAPFGESTDATPATFCGGINFLMHFISENYPQATVAFMAPARRLDDEKAKPIPGRNEDKKPLLAYVDAVIAAGKAHGIPVLDLYRDLGINPNDDKQRAEFTSDGLHFNDKGHGVIAEKLAEFIESI